jgi:hypothetical protein
MKYFFTLSFILIYTFCLSQKVYTVEYQNQADLKVYKVKNQNQADKNEGR